MALASNLSVYIDTYTMVKELANVQVQMPKMWKFSLGEKIFTLSLSLFGFIESANRATDESKKTYFKNQYLMTLETIKTLLRLSYDLRCISDKKYAQLSLYMDSVGRQMTAWKNR